MGEKSINIKFPIQDSVKGFFVETTKTTEDAIRSDLMHLLFTMKGERYYKPKFGSDLYKFIFEPDDQVTSDEILENVNECIKEFIPNLQVNAITVTGMEDELTKVVNINYTANEGALLISNTIEVIL